MRPKNQAICLALLMLVVSSEALRILVVFPIPSKSHSILGQGVVTRLLQAGHEVVHFTSFLREKPVANLTEIDVSSIGNVFRKQSEQMDTFKLKNLIGKGNMADSVFFLYFTYEMHRQFLQHDKVIELLSDPKETFDAVVLEWFFSEINAGIPHLLKCPLIWLGSTEAHWQVLRIIDEIPNTAYNVELFSTSRAPLSFWERAWELWKLIKKFTIVNFIVMPFENSNYNSIFSPMAAKRGVEMPSYYEAIYNGSLILLNSHPSIGTPYRLPQNAKYIAGYHIDDNPKPLPNDLQQLMDNTKNGAIYFSMGSNLKSSDMSDEMIKSLMNVFSKLKETVIWKFEVDYKDVPSNVHLVKWAPQTGIISHPNLKLFITHGGQLSTTEAIYYGVPIIGIPVMADQNVNMKSVEERGFGIRIEISENVAIPLEAALKEMLGNPSYKAKAKELSLIYHDRPMRPGSEMVYWIEHVVATGGAPHLRSPALLASWYQKIYLDLLIFILIVLYSFYSGIKYVLKKFKTKNRTEKEKTKRS